MPQDLTQQLLERHGQIEPEAPFQFPESIQGLMAPVMENPPGEDGMRNAMSYYMNNYGFPELQTALEAGGVGDYSRSPQETIPGALQGFFQGEGDPMEKERQAKIFLSLLQGGGGPQTPFSG